MKTHIGNDRCTRCGGGASPCPVCNPVEEETQPKRGFRLAFDAPLSKQLRGRVSAQDGEMLDQLNEARKTLLDAGCFPQGRSQPVERQILIKAQRCMWQFSHASGA